jgi:periplasmic divalent cation tolerance protein
MSNVMESDAEFVAVLTTLPNRDDAQRLAAALVALRLAACAQTLGPLCSTYRWDGKVETSDEWLLILKTRGDAYPLVEHEIRARHPYQTPQIVALPIVAGLVSYLQWIDAEVRQMPRTGK